MRVALIGCGAIARSFHGPAVARAAESGLTVVLIDPDLGRAKALAASLGCEAEVATSHSDVSGPLDGAIICTPHHLHVPIARDLVADGVAVLSEKPLGTSLEEVRALKEEASEAGVPVMVNHTRRYIPAARLIHEMVREGALGAVRSVDMDEGDRFGWPAATPSMFGADAGGRGVLLDIGVHALDLAVWWLGDGFDVERHEDDSFGGGEASSRTTLKRGDLKVALRLSWLARRRNRYRIEGADGVLEWSIYDLDRVTVSHPGKGQTVVRAPQNPSGFDALAHDVLRDFLAVMEGRIDPPIGIDDALATMALMERCYEVRDRFELPWHPFEWPASVTAGAADHD